MRSKKTIPELGSAAITLRNVSKNSERGAVVLDDLSCEVGAGQSIALIGSSESGKSMLLRCCVGLSQPERGTVTLLGQDLGTLTPRRLKKLHQEIAFLFQEPMLKDDQTALMNVLCRSFGKGSTPSSWIQARLNRKRRKQALELLEVVDLHRQAGKKVADLSAEERQKVAIAQTLLHKPRVIVADDPVAHFGPQTADEMMQLLLHYVRSERATFLFSSHHLEHAIKFADRILALCSGRFELDAPVRDQSEGNRAQFH